MHLFFIDESGTPPSSGKGTDKYFVMAGVIIPDTVWHKLRADLIGLKIRKKVKGEVKWRYFAPTNTEINNPMRRMTPQERNEVRDEMFKIIAAVKSVKAIACVTCIEAAYKIPSVADRDDLYHFTYKPLTERFQYYLQDLTRSVGRSETGLIIADHRGARDDVALRIAHEKLLAASADFSSNYKNLVESLMFQPSDLSVGIQFADIAAGAVWRKYEKGDDRWYKALEPSLRKAPDGKTIEGYGVIKQPKATWK